MRAYSEDSLLNGDPVLADLPHGESVDLAHLSLLAQAPTSLPFDVAIVPQLECKSFPHGIPAPPAFAAEDAGADDSLALERTRMCKFFARGRCTRESCTFAHSRQQLRSQPDLYRTQICLDMINRGQCRVGERCKFAHSLQEIRAPGPSKPSKTEKPKRRRPNRGHNAQRSEVDELTSQLHSVQQHLAELEAQLHDTLQEVAQAAPQPPPNLDVRPPLEAELMRLEAQLLLQVSESSDLSDDRSTASGSGGTAPSWAGSDGVLEAKVQRADNDADDANGEDAALMSKPAIVHPLLPSGLALG